MSEKRNKVRWMMDRDSMSEKRNKVRRMMGRDSLVEKKKQGLVQKTVWEGLLIWRKKRNRICLIEFLVLNLYKGFIELLFQAAITRHPF